MVVRLVRVACGLFLLLEAANGKTMFPEKMTLCGGDDLLVKSHIDTRKGEGEEMLFTGYVYSPEVVDETFNGVMKIHLPEGDSWTDDPMVINFPDPCNFLNGVAPDIVAQMVAANGTQPECPVKAGNFTFVDNSFKMSLDAPMASVGYYKMVLETYKDGKMTSCLEIVFKLNDD